jgi:hypothetical protein
VTAIHATRSAFKSILLMDIAGLLITGRILIKLIINVFVYLSVSPEFNISVPCRTKILQLLYFKSLSNKFNKIMALIFTIVHLTVSYIYCG